MDEIVEKPDILIVDDVPANLVALQRLLKKSDANIIKARSGFEALELTIKYDFALVLLDVQMPEIDGYETAEMMHSAEHSRNIPIIFVTANSTGEENVMRGYSVGAVDYVTKPVNGTILSKKVDVFVQLYKQKRDFKRMNKRLRIAQRVADESNQLKSEFLANMSHELRTPMHAILGFCELGILCVDEWEKSDHVENMEEIKDSADRLLILLNDLLDLSKLEANAACFNFKKTDLRALSESAVKALKPLIDEKKLQVDISSLPFLVECDSLKVLQVLMNFLSNAIKFTQAEKTLSIVIEASEIRSGRRVSDTTMIPAIQLSVLDEGLGIPEGELEKVFDKFVQSSKTKTGAGGTGLGLAISKKIIEGHCGHTWAENRDEGGSKFSFILPVSQDREKG